MNPTTAPAIEPAEDQASRLRRLVREASLPDADETAVHSAAAEKLEAAQTLAAEPIGGDDSNDREWTGRLARVLTIASGKGGVGKTCTAVNLCVHLARRGCKAVLIDADLGTADADLLCGLHPTRRLEHTALAPERGGLDAIALSAPGGFRLVPGTVGLAGLSRLGRDHRPALWAAVEEMERTQDVIVVDVGAGIGPDVLAMLDAADLGLVIATPEPTSLADAYALIKSLVLHRQRGGPDGCPGAAHSLGVGLVANQVAGQSEATRVHQRLSAVSERFLGHRLPLLGWVPGDARVPASVRAKSPYAVTHPKTPASVHVGLLADGLVRRLRIARSSPAARRAVGLGAVLARLGGRGSEKAWAG